MSDLEDRGAYTPFSREQLAFDPRDMRRRRPVPLTLMASAVVLVALGGVALMFYQSGVRGRNQPPRAIGTPVGPIKTPPIGPGANAAPADRSLDVYVQDRPEPGAAQPVYTPAPEQPGPRTAEAQPAPQAAVHVAPPALAKTDTDTAEALAPAPAPAKAAKAVTPKPVVLAAKAPPKPTALAAAQPAKPKPDAKAAAPLKTAAADKAAAATGGAGVVQIGAYSSKALAEQEFAKVRSGFAKFTAGRSTHVEGVQKGSATLYRAAFTGFSKAQATAFCGALKAAGRACIVK